MSKRAEKVAWKVNPRVSQAEDMWREIFVQGYEQAEKDLALTSEDIEKIVDIHRDVLYDNPKRIMGAKENYEDTLRKFNEWREKI